MQKELVEIPLTTLEFYKYEENGLVYYEFDATQCHPPEPMVNAINGLKVLKNENDRLVGIFFHEPTPLYEKIDNAFNREVIELESGDFRVIFKLVTKV